MRGAINFTQELVKIGLETQRQEQAFAAMTKAIGVNGEALVTALEGASRGLADVSDNMTTAVRALQAGLDPEQLVELMKVATAQAVLMGTTTTEAFNQITVAVVNNQEKALKSAGITADLTGAHQKLVDTLGTEVKYLTDAQRSQATYAEVVDKTKLSVETLTGAQLTASQQAEKAQVAYNNLWQTIAVGFVQGIGGVVLAIEASTTAVNDFSVKAATAYVGFGTNIAAARDSVAGFVTALFTATDAMAAGATATDAAIAAQRDANLAWKDGEVTVVGLGTKVLDLGKNLQAAAEAARAMASGMQTAFASVEESVRKASLTGLAKDADDILDKFRQFGPQVVAALEPWAKSVAGVKQGYKDAEEATKRASDEVKKAADEAKKFGEEWEKAIRKTGDAAAFMLDDVEKLRSALEFENLEAQIKGLEGITTTFVNLQKSIDAVHMTDAEKELAAFAVELRKIPGMGEAAVQALLDVAEGMIKVREDAKEGVKALQDAAKYMRDLGTAAEIVKAPLSNIGGFMGDLSDEAEKTGFQFKGLSLQTAILEDDINLLETGFKNITPAIERMAKSAEDAALEMAILTDSMDPLLKVASDERWDAFGKSIEDAFLSVTDTFTKMANGLIAGTLKIGDAFANLGQSLLTNFVQVVIHGVFDEILKEAASFVTDLFKILMGKQVTGGLAAGLIGALFGGGGTAAAAPVISDMNVAAEGLTNSGESLVEGGAAIITGASALTGSAGLLWGAINAWSNVSQGGLAGGLFGFGGKAGFFGEGLLGEFVLWTHNSIMTWIEGIKQGFTAAAGGASSGIFDAITSTLGAAWGTIKETFSGISEAIINNLGKIGTVAGVAGAAAGIAFSIKGAIEATNDFDKAWKAIHAALYAAGGILLLTPAAPIGAVILLVTGIVDAISAIIQAFGGPTLGELLGFGPSAAWLSFPERLEKNLDSTQTAIDGLWKGIEAATNMDEVQSAIDTFIADIAKFAGGFGAGIAPLTIPVPPGATGMPHEGGRVADFSAIIAMIQERITDPAKFFERATATFMQVLTGLGGIPVAGGTPAIAAPIFTGQMRPGEEGFSRFVEWGGQVMDITNKTTVDINDMFKAFQDQVVRIAKFDFLTEGLERMAEALDLAVAGTDVFVDGTKTMFKDIFGNIIDISFATADQLKAIVDTQIDQMATEIAKTPIKLLPLLDMKDFQRAGETIEETTKRVATALFDLGTMMKNVDREIALLGTGGLEAATLGFKFAMEDISTGIEAAATAFQENAIRLDASSGMIGDPTAMVEAAVAAHDLLVARYQAELEIIKAITDAVGQLYTAANTVVGTAARLQELGLLPKVGMEFVSGLTEMATAGVGTFPGGVGANLAAGAGAVSMFATQSMMAARTLDTAGMESAFRSAQNLISGFTVTLDQINQIKDPSERLAAYTTAMGQVGDATIAAAQAAITYWTALHDLVAGMMAQIDAIVGTLADTGKVVSQNAGWLVKAGVDIKGMSDAMLGLIDIIPTVTGKLTALGSGIELAGAAIKAGQFDVTAKPTGGLDIPGLAPAITAALQPILAGLVSTFTAAMALQDPGQRLAALNAIMANIGTLLAALPPGVADALVKFFGPEIQALVKAQQEAAAAQAAKLAAIAAELKTIIGDKALSPENFLLATVKGIQDAMQAIIQGAGPLFQTIVAGMVAAGADINVAIKAAGVALSDALGGFKTPAEQLVAALNALRTEIGGAMYKAVFDAINAALGAETGLPYVPKTGIYKLHQGEAVLTAEENAAFLRGGIGSFQAGTGLVGRIASLIMAVIGPALKDLGSIGADLGFLGDAWRIAGEGFGKLMASNEQLARAMEAGWAVAGQAWGKIVDSNDKLAAGMAEGWAVAGEAFGQLMASNQELAAGIKIVDHAFDELKASNDRLAAGMETGWRVAGEAFGVLKGSIDNLATIITTALTALPAAAGIPGAAGIESGIPGGGLAPDVTKSDAWKLMHPGLQMGTPYVPSTGLYLLHQGEGVLTAAENRAGRTATVNVTVNVAGHATREDAEYIGQVVARKLKGGDLRVIVERLQRGTR